MAKKYIDADRFKAEIEKWKFLFSKEKENKDASKTDKLSLGGRIAMLEEILVLVDSLQQEQPCDTCTNDKGCVTCKDGELWEGKEQPCEDLEKKCATCAYFDTRTRWNGYCDAGAEKVVVAAETTCELWKPYDMGNLEKKQFLKGDRLTELDKSYKQAKRELEWFKEGKRQGREQMMEEVTECELVCIKGRLLAVLPMKEFRWTAGDKAHIIIVKEDKK